MHVQEFTTEQVDAMREALRKIDNVSRPKDIDMSLPIIVHTPYKPFPKVVYNHEGCLPSRFETRESAVLGGKSETKAVPPVFDTKIVNSPLELDAALADGWKTEAPAFNDAPKSEKRRKAA